MECNILLVILANKKTQKKLPHFQIIIYGKADLI